MHTDTIENWRHHHVFLGAHHARNEWRTWIVVALTAVMMVGEIIAGLAFGSMALLADGVHMATHAGARLRVPASPISMPAALRMTSGLPSVRASSVNSQVIRARWSWRSLR